MNLITKSPQRRPLIHPITQSLNHSITNLTRLLLFTTFCWGILFDLKAQNKMETNAIFPKGDKLTNGYFTGDAYLQPLLARDKNSEFVMGSVSFEPGARTNWHVHPKGQVLVVIEGEGFYQQKGKPAQVIKKGDVINIPENTEHWHGASAKSKMVHIAITHFKDDVNVVWLKAVSEQEYSEANNE